MVRLCHAAGVLFAVVEKLNKTVCIRVIHIVLSICLCLYIHVLNAHMLIKKTSNTDVRTSPSINKVIGISSVVKAYQVQAQYTICTLITTACTI